MAKDDLDGVLADLKRQRDDLERKIRDLEESRGDTSDILDRLKKLRERSEKSG
jgi:hypothetical protein